MERFINRSRELEILEAEYQRSGASFVVIYGRRRIGKTALIRHFCQEKESVFFLASEEYETENRKIFQQIIAEYTQNELLSSVDGVRWDLIFSTLADYMKQNSSGRKLILAIDEFQYIGKANPSFPSILMKIWDMILKDCNIMLILCGSLINMMHTQVLSYNSPLYGRRTAQIHLKQIPFEHYHEFMPSLTTDEQIMHYAVTGGVPKYIELFYQQKDIYRAIERNVMETNAFLYAEPEFILQKEVTGIGTYFSILKVIAAGNHKLGNMATVLGVPQSNLSKYLSVLEDLDILERQVPITEENPAKSKKGLYFIKDNYFDFWFRFIYPQKNLLEMGKTDFVSKKIKANFIDNHVSFVYEEICRQHVWNYLSDDLYFDRVGRWWGNKNVEIDIVAYDSTGTTMLFGECKYSRKPKGIDILWNLKEKSASVNWKRNERIEHFAIFSKAGFTDELLAYAEQNSNIHLWQLA